MFNFGGGFPFGNMGGHGHAHGNNEDMDDGGPVDNEKFYKIMGVPKVRAIVTSRRGTLSAFCMQLTHAPVRRRRRQKSRKRSETLLGRITLTRAAMLRRCGAQLLSDGGGV